MKEQQVSIKFKRYLTLHLRNKKLSIYSEVVMESCVSQRFFRMAGDETELGKNDGKYSFL